MWILLWASLTLAVSAGVYGAEGQRENVRIVDVPSFSVIGKLGSGTGATASEWIPPLWHNAAAGLAEIALLIKRNPNGAPAGVWAIMSDHAGTFQPWDTEQGGLYLAGFETEENTVAPDGWAVLRVPAFRYLVVPTTTETYQDTFSHVLQTSFGDNGYTLAGAVHEYYPDPDESTHLELFFPIERLHTD